MRQKLLFICSHNKQRRLTAETILRDSHTIAAKSAGTENGARIKVTDGLIGWADVIFVMEQKHLERLRQKFGDVLLNTPIYILSIPGDYPYIDDELISILKNRLIEYIDL